MSLGDRSYKPIRRKDLLRLAAIARSDREDLFRRNPGLAELYRDRLLSVTLCQGAALHFLDDRNGVKDFDVWTFYKTHPKRPFPPRRNVHRDFGDPRFGVLPKRPEFKGRPVDLIGRSIPCRRGMTPIQAVREYLTTSRADSPRLLAKKAVVILEPEDKVGTIVWPVAQARSG